MVCIYFLHSTKLRIIPLFLWDFFLIWIDIVFLSRTLFSSKIHTDIFHSYELCMYSLPLLERNRVRNSSSLLSNESDYVHVKNTWYINLIGNIFLRILMISYIWFPVFFSSVYLGYWNRMPVLPLYLQWLE